MMERRQSRDTGGAVAQLFGHRTDEQEAKLTGNAGDVMNAEPDCCDKYCCESCRIRQEVLLAKAAGHDRTDACFLHPSLRTGMLTDPCKLSLHSLRWK